MNIELRDIYFGYRTLGREAIGSPYALAGINLSIRENEIVAIVGPSGSGKTTLIQILNGLLQPERGEVLINGQAAGYKGGRASNWLWGIGTVFQFPEIQFFENSVYDEIAYGLRNNNVEESEVRRRIAQVLNELQIEDIDVERQSPFHLSEGQKRRIAIASVLVMDRTLLIFDEPTSALDYSGVQIMQSIIERLYSQKKRVIIASHDMDFVNQLARRILCLNQGIIVFDGPKDEFFDRDDLLNQTHLQIPRILKLERILRQKGQTAKLSELSKWQSMGWKSRSSS